MSYFRYTGSLKMRYVVGVNVLNLALMFAAADINLRPLIERNTEALVQRILTLEEMAKDAFDMSEIANTHTLTLQFKASQRFPSMLKNTLRTSV